MLGYLFLGSSVIALVFLFYTITHLNKLEITMKHPRVIVEALLFFIFLIVGIVLLVSCTDDADKNEDYKVITVQSDWFTVSYLSPKTYILEEPQSSQGNVSYLIIGDNKAIVFDTGSGENKAENGTKIRHIINQITELPVTLILSHFHFDHNQNISEFDHVAFPDLPLLRQKVGMDNIYTFTADDLFIGDYPAKVQVDEWISVNTDIDLGNRILQLVSIPGHSSESIVIIDKTNKIAFLGDYLYNGALFLFDNSDLAYYKTSIDHLISIMDRDYRLFGAHGSPEVEFGKLEDLKNFLICIENGTCQSTAAIVWGYDALLYKYNSMQMVIFQ